MLHFIIKCSNKVKKIVLLMKSQQQVDPQISSLMLPFTTTILLPSP